MKTSEVIKEKLTPLKEVILDPEMYSVLIEVSGVHGDENTKFTLQAKKTKEKTSFYVLERKGSNVRLISELTIELTGPISVEKLTSMSNDFVDSVVSKFVNIEFQTVEVKMYMKESLI